MRTHAAAPLTEGLAGGPAPPKPGPARMPAAPAQSHGSSEPASAPLTPHMLPARETAFWGKLCSNKNADDGNQKSENSHSKAVFVLKWSNTHNKLNLKSTF